MLLGLFVDLPVLDAGQGSIDHILPEAHDLRDGLLEHQEGQTLAVDVVVVLQGLLDQVPQKRIDVPVVQDDLPVLLAHLVDAQLLLLDRLVLGLGFLLLDLLLGAQGQHGRGQLHLPLHVSFDELARELGGRLVLHHLLDVGIELLLGIDFVGCLDDHVGFDVELGQVELQLVFVAVDALSQIVVDFVLQVGSYWMIEQVLPLDTFGGVHYQHFADYVLDYLRQLVWKGQWLFSDPHQQVDNIASRVGHLPKNHLVETDSYRPDVRLAVITLPVQYLWRHVKRRTQDCLDLLIFCAKQFGEPKIGQLYHTFVLENIG